MKKIDVSVVVPSYNEEKLLSLCLRSLINQDFKRKYEIIVVDNASNDNTKSILRKFKVRSIHIDKKNVSLARDVGFRNAYGEIIVSTDADTIVPKNWLSKIYKRFEDDPELIGMSGSASFWDGNIWDNLFVIPHISYNYLNYFLNLGFFTGQNMAIRKKVFDQIGGFDLKKPSAEDLDLCLKLQQIGKIKYCPTIHVKTSARKLKHQGYLKFASYHIYNQLRVSLLKLSPLKMEDVREVKFSQPFTFKNIMVTFIVSSIALYSYLLHTNSLEAREIVQMDLNKKIVDSIATNFDFVEKKVKNLDLERIIR